MFWIGYIIGCLFCGAICYALMQNKGYEQPTGWFFAGFLLGIIGLILVLVQPPQKETTYHSGANSYRSSNNSGGNSPYSSDYGSRSTTVCKSCGSTNSSSSYHCQSCGAKLSPAVSAQKTGKEGSWKCHCGALNYSYETSCHRCGEKKPYKSAYESKSDATVQATVPAQKSITEQLEELKKLQDQGLITETDFEAKKKQILGI